MERRRLHIQRRRKPTTIERDQSHSSSSSSSSSSTTSIPNKSLPNYREKEMSSNKEWNCQSQQQEDRDDETLNSSLLGTCPFMCPVEERLQRERLRDLSVFERLNGSPVKTTPSLAVKKFCRTISIKNVQASDLRPLPVLEETLNYLLNLLNSKDYPFEVVHDFIFDRTRSIRQDLSMQSVLNNKVILMFEKMVNFHVISHHKLGRSEGNSIVSSMYHLNMEQLKKTLSSLYNIYQANRDSGSVYPNEAEFCSLYVLLHLDDAKEPMGESLSLWFWNVSSSILKSKEMVFARKLLRLYRLGNYRSFISATAAEASYMQYCIIEPYINEIRALAICCVNYGGYKLHPYPLADLSNLLMMKEPDVESLCLDCGLETSTDEAGKKFLPTKQTSFCHPKAGVRNYNLVGFEIS